MRIKFILVFLFIVLMGCSKDVVMKDENFIEDTTENLDVQDEQIDEPSYEEVYEEQVELSDDVQGEVVGIIPEINDVEEPEKVELLVPVKSVTQINYTDNMFYPADVTIPIGGKVVWTRQGAKPLMVRSISGKFYSGREKLKEGESFEFTFNQTGDYEYMNVIIASHKGIIRVK